MVDCLVFPGCAFVSVLIVCVFVSFDVFVCLLMCMVVRACLYV